MDDPKIKKLSRGEVLLKEGQSGKMAYYVRSGRLVAYRVREDTRITVGRITPGQVVGELSVLSGKPVTFNVEAEEFTELMELDYMLLKTLLAKCPKSIQGIITFMIERLYNLSQLITEHHLPHQFLSICQIIELLWRCSDGKKQLTMTALARAVRNILPVTAVEIDELVEKLCKIGLVEIEEVKSARYGTDAFGNKVKTCSLVENRILKIPDVENFLTKAKAVVEMWESASAPHTHEFLEVEEFAEKVGTTPEMFYKKLGNNEIPIELLFIHHEAGLRFAQDKGADFFQRTKRKRLDINELSNVDDLVYVDGTTLQDVFSALGFHKVSVLIAGAGAEAKDKLLANLSKKMRDVVTEESASMQLDETELADVEVEAIERIKQLKGILNQSRTAGQG